MSSIKKTFRTLTGSKIQEERFESPYYPPLIESASLPEQAYFDKPLKSSSSIMPKLSRSNYIESIEQKKVNPVVQITQYITNSKYNEQNSKISMQSQNPSAFRAINNQSSSMICSQPKAIINYNDFNMNKIKAQPTLILNHKNPRDEYNNINTINNSNINAMSLTLSQISNRKINKSLLEQITLNQRIRNNAIETNIKSFDEIKGNIEKKTKANEEALKQMQLISSSIPKYEYEEKKKRYTEIYQSKKAKTKDYDYLQYLNDEDKAKNNSHLSLGYGEKVMYKGKAKNTMFKMSQSYSLNFENMQKPMLQPETVDSLPLVNVNLNMNDKDTNNNFNTTDDTKSLSLLNHDSNVNVQDQYKDKEITLEKKKEGLFDKANILFKFQPLSSNSEAPIFLCGDSYFPEKKAELFPQKDKDKSNKDKTIKFFEPQPNPDDKKPEKDTIPLCKIPDTKNDNKLDIKLLKPKDDISLVEQQKEKMKFFLKDQTTNFIPLKLIEKPASEIVVEAKDNKPPELTNPLFDQLDKDKDKDKEKKIQKPAIAIDIKTEENNNKESVISQLKSSLPTNTTLPKPGDGLFGNTSYNSIFGNTSYNSIFDHTSNNSIFKDKSKTDQMLFPIGSSTSFNSLHNKTDEAIGSTINNQTKQNNNEAQMEISPVTSPKIQTQTNPTQIPFHQLNSLSNTIFPKTAEKPNTTLTTTPSTLFNNQPSFLDSINNNNNFFNQPVSNSFLANNNLFENNKTISGNNSNVFGNIKPTNIGSQPIFPLDSSFKGKIEFAIGKK